MKSCWYSCSQSRTSPSPRCSPTELQGRVHRGQAGTMARQRVPEESEKQTRACVVECVRATGKRVLHERSRSHTPLCEHRSRRFGCHVQYFPARPSQPEGHDHDRAKIALFPSLLSRACATHRFVSVLYRLPSRARRLLCGWCATAPGPPRHRQQHRQRTAPHTYHRLPSNDPRVAVNSISFTDLHVPVRHTHPCGPSARVDELTKSRKYPTLGSDFTALFCTVRVDLLRHHRRHLHAEQQRDAQGGMGW